LLRIETQKRRQGNNTLSSRDNKTTGEKQLASTNSAADNESGEEYDVLIEKYEVAVKAGNANAEVWGKLGDAYAGAGIHDKAIKSYEKALLIGPEESDEANIMRNLAGVYAKVANFEKEVETYNLLLKKHPDYVAVLGKVARAYEKSGKTQEAVLFYTRAIQLNKDDPNILYDYSFFCEKLGQKDNAIKALERAIQLKPDSQKILERLTILYSSVKDYDNAIKYRTMFAESDPEDPRKWEDLIQLCREAQKLQAAMSICRNGIRKFNNPSLWEMLGDLYMDAHRPENALYCFNVASGLGNPSAKGKAESLVAKKVNPKGIALHETTFKET
jgi:tetratricopeptide (TPR) repeat protein